MAGSLLLNLWKNWTDFAETLQWTITWVSKVCLSYPQASLFIGPFFSFKVLLIYFYSNYIIFLVLLRSNWHTTLYTFKVYKISIWYYSSYLNADSTLHFLVGTRCPCASSSLFKEVTWLVIHMKSWLNPSSAMTALMTYASHWAPCLVPGIQHLKECCFWGWASRALFSHLYFSHEVNSFLFFQSFFKL